MTTHLTISSNRLNEVMKVLTIISTIFMPLSFVAGIYGMNFKYMPEINWPLGYPMTWIIFILIAAAMILFFRRRHWI
jgi:magnesium transporter